MCLVVVVVTVSSVRASCLGFHQDHFSGSGNSTFGITGSGFGLGLGVSISVLVIFSRNAGYALVSS